MSRTLSAITAEIEKSFDLQWAKDDEPRLRNFALGFLRAALLKVAEETYEATKIEPVGACSIGMCGHKNVDANSANHGVYIGTKAAADEQSQDFKTFINQ